MKTLYIDCGMGAAGDMLTAALLELLPDRDAFLQQLNSLGIPGVEFVAEKSTKCGILGTHIRVCVNGQEESAQDHGHSHGTMADIRAIISGLRIPTMVKLDILAVYEEIAQAESHVHGIPVAQIHFHEVGTMDAIADITAVCLLMHTLKPDHIVASAVHVGSGQVRCAHGILPVPAPATAYLLREIPMYGGSIQGELCTPTGAALLKHFVHTFGDMPVMQVQSIGYGMGKRDFARANCVRVMLGESAEVADGVWELKCNVDDMTGEQMGFAMEVLMAQGALDVFTMPIGMKKGRPGILLTVLCREAEKETMISLLLRHTTTLGIRESFCHRHTLKRTVETVDTPYGAIRKKVSTGYGVQRCKYEYEDLCRIAKETGLSIQQVLSALE